MGSSDKKHILDSISICVSKKKKYCSTGISHEWPDGVGREEEKEDRKTFGEITRRVKILPAVPMMFLQFVELCPFTYWLPQQHSLATQEKSRLEDCSSSLGRLHQPDQSRAILRSGTVCLLLPGCAFPWSAVPAGF